MQAHGRLRTVLGLEVLELRTTPSTETGEPFVLPSCTLYLHVESPAQASAAEVDYVLPHDLIEEGGVLTAVAGRIQIWDTPIENPWALQRIFYEAQSSPNARLAAATQNACKLVSSYHGTSGAVLPSILKEGLRPSFGMMGTAFYTGTFFKAARYAVFEQDYRRHQRS